MATKVLRSNFFKNCKMHTCCSSDELRPTMQHIYFANGFAYASDDHVLVKNHLSEIIENIDEEQLALLDGKMLHKDHYKNLLQYDGIVISEDGIEGNKDGNKVFFYFTDQTKHGEYPDAEKVLQEALNKKPIQTSEFCIQPGFIAQVCSANPNLNICKMQLKEEGKLIINEKDDMYQSMALVMLYIG